MSDSPAPLPPAAPVATILITTKNRRDDLRRAIESCARQHAGSGAIEMLVISDGSTDGTPEMVKAEFPQVRMVHHDQSMGYIHRRNEGAAIARAPVVFSIDDDAAFTEPTTVEATLRELGASPRVGAVAIPYVDVTFSDNVEQRAPDAHQIWVAAHYRGTAHALRRDLFLWLGGYQRHLVHQTEEAEYCARMLSAGYVTRLGAAPPVDHFESPKRSYARQYRFNARNHVLFAWFNCPWWFLPAQWFFSSLKMIKGAIPKRAVWPACVGLMAGYYACLRLFRFRRPLPSSIYFLFRRLRRRGTRPLPEVESMLPPMQAIGAPQPALMAELRMAGN